MRLVKSKDESLRKDLAHVFDRRRAIMDAAIVRILKSGSESIDTVATMVRNVTIVTLLNTYSNLG